MKAFCSLFGLLVWMTFPFASGTAQSASPMVLTFAGGYAEIPEGAVSLSWTAGELIVETVAVGDRILTQGFQQNELFVNPVHSAGAPLAVKVFPNPTRRRLTIEFTEPHTATLEMFDLRGKRVLAQTIRGERTEVQLGHLPAALYLLRIVGADRSEQSCKIHIVH